MGVEYTLVNNTKKEQVSFIHLNGSKKRELAGDPAQAAMVTWYLLNNQGDDIQFVSDTYDDWPFEHGGRELLNEYPDRTESVINELIKNDVLADRGMLYVDEEDPDTVYVKNIVNVWSSGET